MRRLIAHLALCALLGLLPSHASAQTCSATPSALSFGNVSPIALSSVPATGSILVQCTWPAVTLLPSAQVCLNLAGPASRSMLSGTTQLQYGLYQDTGHSIGWGSTALGTTPISLVLDKPVTGLTASTTVFYYGLVAANQPSVPTTGNSSTAYSDNVTQLTVNYAFFLLLSPGCAGATSSTSGTAFNVGATVINNCLISATNIAFASQGVLNSALSATGAITARCTNGDAFRISLNGGSSGNVAARQMQRSGGGGAVKYQLYVDSGHANAWGDGSAGTTMATGTGTGNPVSINVYGLVPAQSTPMPGSYSDSITATISF
jgi:spore coat protein U-like protein